MNLYDLANNVIDSVDQYEDNIDLKTRIEKFTNIVDCPTKLINSICRKNKIMEILREKSLLNNSDFDLCIPDTLLVYLKEIIDRLKNSDEDNLDTQIYKFQDFNSWLETLEEKIKDNNNNSWQCYMEEINPTKIEAIIDKNRFISKTEMLELKSLNNDVIEFKSKLPLSVDDLKDVISKVEKIKTILEKYAFDCPPAVEEFYDLFQKSGVVSLEKMSPDVFGWLFDNNKLSGFTIYPKKK